MNDLALGVVMLCSFALAVYGAHALVQRLRRRGHGTRLDAIHDATVKAQAQILRAIGGASRASRSGRNALSAAPPPVDHSDTKRD
ncbi:MAG TPA: hypothetical protein ENN80_06960 [Candidatus Hydrogenedentes bacterium]|nr:hypothetical protein [Candidatus Hydrogenedentota bacterium]